MRGATCFRGKILEYAIQRSTRFYDTLPEYGFDALFSPIYGYLLSRKASEEPEDQAKRHKQIHVDAPSIALDMLLP